ncbi:hypothetical protein [Luteimonas notoginsengisoli]|uniref:Uncharacterized protein n=1 Tax=Luteimonas notoginsengisoli TaxID=1578200 RepID=A0ABV7UQW6_9GAMM
MAEPASWLVLEYIRDVLRAITVANGYRTDLGDGAFILDDSDVPDDIDAPATVIEATTVPVSTSSRAHINSDASITVEFAVPRGDGSTNPKLLAHRARADIVKALMVDTRTLPPFIRTLELVDAQLFGADDASGASFHIAQVSARAGLTELKSPAP